MQREIPDMVKDCDKNLYRLWWEYLKRSDRYKKYIEWEEKVEQDKQLSIPKELMSYHDSLWWTARSFGNVQKNKFSQWWKNEQANKLPCPITLTFTTNSLPIIDYREFIDRDIKKIYRTFKKEIGREPSINELTHNIKIYMNDKSSERLYLLINFQFDTIDDITRLFHDFLKKRKKECLTREKEMIFKGMRLETTTKKKHYEELQRYLAIYDEFKSGKAISEIAREIEDEKEDEGDDKPRPPKYYVPDTERICRRDRAKAQKIIHNVEKGYFPGDY